MNKQRSKDQLPPRGQVLMKEEVFATWVATSLIIAVMGSQFTGREDIDDSTRIFLDVITMGLAFLVLSWAFLSYFGMLHIGYRRKILGLLIFSILFFYIYVTFLILTTQI